MNRLSFVKNLLAMGGLSLLPPGMVKNFRKFYLLQCFVAGFRFNKGMEVLPQMKEGDLLHLVREPDNAFDACAIALYWNELKIGYVPKAENQMLSKLLDADALDLMGEIAYLNKEVKPWENLHVAIYFLKAWEGELPAQASYLTELKSPSYQTIKQKDNLITRIQRSADEEEESESDWYRYLVHNAGDEAIVGIIQASDLDRNFRYGATTGDYLVVNKYELDEDDFTEMHSGHVEEIYTRIVEYYDELTDLFGEKGYVVLSTQEASDLISRVVGLAEIADKLGNRYIRLKLG